MKVVCIGDSLTHGYKIKNTEIWTNLLKERYQLETINKGIIGETTDGMLSRFQSDVIENLPTHVIIMGGFNDLVKNISVEDIFLNIKNMVYKAKDSGITPVIGIPILSEPTMARQYWEGVADFNIINKQLTKLREKIIDFAFDYDIHIIDFFKEVDKHITIENKFDFYIDGVHLSGKGNEFMASLVNL